MPEVIPEDLKVLYEYDNVGINRAGLRNLIERLGAAEESARVLREALTEFAEAAESWHKFHNHTQIQCDRICAAIAPARAALRQAGVRDLMKPARAAEGMGE